MHAILVYSVGVVWKCPTYPLHFATFFLLLQHTYSAIRNHTFHTSMHLHRHERAFRVKLSSPPCVRPCPALIQHAVTINVGIHMGHTHTTNRSCQYTSGNSDDAGSIAPTLHFQSTMKHSNPRKWKWWRCWEATASTLRPQAGPYINPAVKFHERGRSVASKCTKQSFSYRICHLTWS